MLERWKWQQKTNISISAIAKEHFVRYLYYFLIYYIYERDFSEMARIGPFQLVWQLNISFDCISVSNKFNIFSSMVQHTARNADTVLKARIRDREIRQAYLLVEHK